MLETLHLLALKYAFLLNSKNRANLREVKIKFLFKLPAAKGASDDESKKLNVVLVNQDSAK